VVVMVVMVLSFLQRQAAELLPMTAWLTYPRCSLPLFLLS